MKRTMLITLAAVAMIAAMVYADPVGFGRGSGDRSCLRDGPGMGSGPGMRGECGPGHARGRFGDRLGVAALLRHADDIGLTDRQLTQLKQMDESFALERIEKQATVKKAQVQLHAVLADDEAMETEVDAAIDRVAQARADMQKMRYRHHREVRDLLTEAQQQKIKELRRGQMQGQPRPGRPGNRRGMGHGFWFNDDPDTNG